MAAASPAKEIAPERTDHASPETLTREGEGRHLASRDLQRTRCDSVLTHSRALEAMV